MRCLKPCFLSSHGIRGRSETRFDNSVSRPDPHVVTVGPVGRLGPRRFGALCASAFFSAVFPSRRPYAACLHITPFPAVACFPLPKACACRARTCWGFLRPVPAFSGPLPRHSPFPFVVKTVCQMAKNLSICFLPNGKLFLSTKKPPLFHRGGSGC